MKTLIALLIITGSINAAESSDKFKDEIIAVEIAFAKMAAKDGLKKAFLYFAADGAVLTRNSKLIKGKVAIAKYFDNNPADFKKFEWLPDFVEVSISGDLGYTYGPYEYEILDKDAKLQKGNGIFHTVWKRQKNGEWKYVWD